MIEPDFLKENDHDRFVLSLLIKDRADQQCVQVIDALNIELARLKDVIDTPHMGYIRLQWWRDEIGKIYAGQAFAPHPVLLSFQNRHIHKTLAYQDIEQVISARESDFEEYDSFDIFNYARTIHAPLFNVKSVILGMNEKMPTIAEGYAVIGLLRSIPYYKSRSQVLIPSIQPQAVEGICQKALDLIASYKTDHPYFKGHCVLARLYAKQMRACGYHIDKLLPLPFKELRLWWNVCFS